jgi:hypothetical protein
LSTSSINRNIQITQQRLQLLRNESEEHNALTQAELAAIKLTQMQTVDAVNHLTQFLKEVMPQLPNIQGMVLQTGPLSFIETKNI